MKKRENSFLPVQIAKGLMATTIAFCLLLFATVTALANVVTINDGAGVLNASQVRSEASSLSYPISIYTIANYNGSNSQFDQTARQYIRSNNMIILAVNVRGHVYTNGGQSVPLSSSQYTQAANAFVSDYRSNRSYTSAIIAAIRSMRDMLSNSSSSNGGFFSNYNPVGGGIGTGGFCCIGLLILGGLLLFARARRGRGNPGGGFGGGFFNRGGGMFNRRYNNQPYNQPYVDNNYPPNYGPSYGPGYPQQGQGMNPLAAGGLGAVGGGLLGYELGRQQGEREARGDGGLYGGNAGFGGDNSGGSADFDPGNGGGFGGDSGGGSADFGGGGDFGGGSDFGGGGGGDFGGGGGDSGGGGSF